jgi:hypothetical protein
MDSQKKEAAQSGSIQEATAQKAVGAASSRPPGSIKKNKKWNKFEKLKSSAQQGAFISDKISDDNHPTGSMDVNPVGSKVSEGMSNKDNCGATGIKELNILPTKCKSFLFYMGIYTASISNAVGELATKYQAWHKLTAN